MYPLFNMPSSSESLLRNLSTSSINRVGLNLSTVRKHVGAVMLEVSKGLGTILDIKFSNIVLPQRLVALLIFRYGVIPVTSKTPVCMTHSAVAATCGPSMSMYLQTVSAISMKRSPVSTSSGQGSGSGQIEVVSSSPVGDFADGKLFRAAETSFVAYPTRTRIVQALELRHRLSSKHWTRPGGRQATGPCHPFL
jgi:hypothetical protein